MSIIEKIDETEQTKAIIKLWQSLNIEKAVMGFDCGGDSMNDTQWELISAKNESIDNDEIVSYLEDRVYNEVTFYENSDGHYIGEFGKVIVILETEDYEEPTFTYDKQSTSEWNETHYGEFEMALTPAEIKFVESKVLNINGGESGRPTINYKGDFILTDEEEQIAETLPDRLDEFARDCKFEEAEGEQNDWYSWNTDVNDEEDETPTLTEKGIMLKVEQTYTELRDENE